MWNLRWDVHGAMSSTIEPSEKRDSAKPSVPPPGSHSGPQEATILSKRSPATAAAATEAPTFPHDRVDDFEILELVGRGSMGAVYRARDALLQRDVAVKILQRSLAEDLPARFRQEAQSAAQLQHENIAAVHQFGQTDDYCFLAMEFVEGRNLREIVADSGPMSAREAFLCALQMASALTHIAERGVVHRDVKPSNVIRTSQGRYKLVDLGLARFGARDDQGDLTESGMTLGTFDYVSPEQARDPRLADIRSDLYSLGCTLFFVLTGRPPFPEGTPLQKLLQHQGDAPPDVRQFRPDVPDELAEVIDRLLAKNAEHRYQHPHEMAADLRRSDWAAEFSGGPGDRASASRAWRRWIPAAVCLAIVAVLGVRSDPPRPAAGPLPVLYEPGIPGGRESPSADSTTTPSDAGAETAWPSREANGPLGAGGVDSEAEARITTGQDRNLIVVADSVVAGVRRSYSSLAAALAAAADGDVIELRFDGVRSMEPVLLSGDPGSPNALKKITLRGAPGRRPALAFLPGELTIMPSRDAPIRSALFTLQGVQLTLLGLDLTLDAPPDGGMPRNWSLFRCVGDNSVRLDRCLATVRRTSRPLELDRSEATVFETVASRGLSMRTVRESAHLELQDCIVRSDGVFLRLVDHCSASVIWRNGFFATSERFLHSAQRPREGGGQADVELRRVTMSLGAGFYRGHASDFAAATPPTEVRAGDCIFRMASNGAFLEILEDEDGALLADSFRWRPDHGNFFNGVDKLLRRWRGDQLQDYAFGDGNVIFGDVGAAQRLSDFHWEQPLPSIAASAMRPEMFRLNHDAVGNPAVHGASDGGDAGFREQDLPSVPESR